MQHTVWHTCGFIFFILVKYVHCQSYVGDDCIIKKTRTPGKCQLLKKCPAALQDLRKRIYPQNCGFEGSHPIVCCGEKHVDREPSMVATTTMMPATSTMMPVESTMMPVESTMMPVTSKTHNSRLATTTMISPTVENMGIGEKSKQKCHEYGSHDDRRVIQAPGPNKLSIQGCQYDSSGLIRGGSYALAKEFPHMAAVGFDGENNKRVWECGGTLISELFVLTAAHCLYHYMYGVPRYIRLGDLILNSEDDDASPQQFRVKEKISHPDYKPPSQYNDIALLKMDREAQFNQYTKPACLVTNPAFTTTLVLASSWGKINRTTNNPQRLLVHRLECITRMECNEIYGNYAGKGIKDGIMDETQLCATSASKDTCQTNTGGPVQIYHEKYCLYNIIGVTSFAKPCGVINVPGIYTRISAYIQWIEDIVWPEPLEDQLIKHVFKKQYRAK